MAKKKNYGKESFAVKEGLDGIREKPTMYLGALGSAMLHRMVEEVKDNCFDEYMAGRNSTIEIVYNQDKDFIIVADTASGIPLDKIKLKDGSKMSILTAAFFKTHSSGKFDDGAYKASTGTHGIGVSAVNACSDKLQVWTYAKKPAWYTQEFIKGELVTEHPVKGAPAKIITKYLSQPIKKYGTIVKFVPDHTVIAENATSKARKSKNFKPKLSTLDMPLLLSQIRDLVNLNPKLTVTVTWINKKKKKTITSVNKETVAKCVLAQIEDRNLATLAKKPIDVVTEEFTLALCWTDVPNTSEFKTFVNSKRTIDNGYHVDGFKSALEKAIKPYAKGKAAQKGKKGASKSDTYKRDDLLLGLFGYFDWRMHGAQFSSQIKDKLESRVDKDVEAKVLPKLVEFFEKNSALARAIIKRAVEYNKQLQSVSKVMQSLTEARKKSKIPDSLSVATRPKGFDVEQFWVEGDSAGGTAKNGRDNKYQEVLKLGGKPINVVNNSLAKIMSNAVVQELSIALGIKFDELSKAIKAGNADNFTFSCDKLRTKYVMIMADADPDGYHIAVTLTAFFMRFMPQFIKDGRLFIVDMPLFIGTYNKKLYGSNDVDDLISQMPKGASSRHTKRAKGLGEMSPVEIAYFGMHPDTRKLKRVNYPDTKEDLEWFFSVVGDSAHERRVLLGID